jgi:hypothetical protein
MASVSHFGFFPPAKFISGSQFVTEHCLESVDIEFADEIDYTGEFAIDVFRVPVERDGVIQSPFRVTLKEAIDFYWRVKTWDLRWIQSIEEGAEPPEYDWEEDVGVPDSEKSLVCGQGVGNPINITADEFAPFRQCEILGSFNRQNAKLRPILINEDNEYFVNIKTIGSREDTQVIIRATKLEDSLSWRLEGDIYDQDGEGNQVEFVGTTIFEIGPDKWWPYDPNDGGGPIYDEDTGEQIRSF